MKCIWSIPFNTRKSWRDELHESLIVPPSPVGRERGRGENSPKQSRFEPMNLPKWVPLFRGGTANLAVLGGNLPPSLARETFCDPVTSNALGCRAGRPTERASGPFHPIHLLAPRSSGYSCYT